MPAAVLDSNVLIDYKDTSVDSRHERAEEIVLYLMKSACASDSKA